MKNFFKALLITTVLLGELLLGLESFAAVTPQISAGDSFTVALKNDGTVWAWGWNYYGQLGNGSSVIQRSTESKVAGLTGITAISSGSAHTIALKSDGTVWSWGLNTKGQLGDGTTTQRSTPVKVTGLSGITAVAAGGHHTVALKNDGTVWTWGNNSNGQIGNNNTTNQSVPYQILDFAGATITAISAGMTHSIALKSDGTVWAWGSNGFGQLGDGSTTQRLIPTKILGLSGITAVTAGGYNSFALQSNGSVWTWGSNGSGELGDGSTTQRNAPVQLADFLDVIKIAGGNWHTVALKNDGSVWTWGRNEMAGQLGDGTTLNRTSPINIATVSGIIDVDAGAYHTTVLKDDGSVWAWGANGFGQLGDGTTSQRTTPVQVPELSTVTAIGAGYYHGSAIKSDGTIWGWGRNYNYQLGDASQSNRTEPTQALGVDTASIITSGGCHNIALKNDSTVWAWGSNDWGQLGDGTITKRTLPVQVTGLSGVITSLSAGREHSIALKGDGTAWGWGYNFYGQLGNGSTTNQQTTPVLVSGLSEIVAIEAGGEHSIGLKIDGTVWTWGNNIEGQLGSGNYSNRSTPGQVAGLSGVRAIAAGDTYSAALKDDGTIWTWGRGGQGQLGYGGLTTQNTPVQVAGIIDAVAIAAGTGHTIALKGDGTVWAWGYNSAGQIGDGSKTIRATPVQVAGLTGVIALSAGESHTMALKGDGTVWTWGDNTMGQLGINNGIHPVQSLVNLYIPDNDGDGEPNTIDNCPAISNADQADIDDDGIGDQCDNCPTTSNSNQTDADGDGYGVACDCNDTNASIYPGASELCDGLDNDCDGTVDEDLTAPLTAKQQGVCAGTKQTCGGVLGWLDIYNIIVNYEEPEQAYDNLDNDCDGQIDEGDVDSDGVIDYTDNCPYTANPDQLDSDGDGLGNMCDNCPAVTNPDQADADGDGKGDQCDNCPLNANPDQANYDGDALGNVCDPDGDNDGISDSDEIANGTNPYNADIIPPRLTVSTLDGHTTNDAALTVSGTASDNASLPMVTVNNMVTTVTGGNYSHPVTLTAGSNTLTVIATDAAWNKTTITRFVTLDQSAPTVTITAPTDNSSTALAQTTVTGNCGDATTVTIKVNTGNEQVAAITDGVYTLTVNLIEGQNTITATATDAAGNSNSSAVRTVTYDATDPTVSITLPGQDITVGSSPYELQGTVSDALGTVSVTATINGEVAAVTLSDGSFTVPVTFTDEGTYQVIVTATDEVGNSANATRNLIYAAYLIGDADGNGTVTSSDALTVLQVVVGKVILNPNQKNVLDVAPLINGKPAPDGLINAADALLILRKAVGLW